MIIHLPTLILVIAISGILNIFILLAHYKINKKIKGILQWVAGFTALVISQFVSFFLEHKGNLSAVIISDVLLVSAFLFIAAGLKLFLAPASNAYISLYCFH